MSRHPTWAAAVAAASASILVTTGGGALGAPALAEVALGSEPPNILIINLDDLRATGTLSSMPRVRDYFEQGGRTFTQSFASTPLCSPSRASLFTGRYPHNHGVTGNGLDTEIAALDQSAMMQGYLQSSGYLTAMAGKYINTVPLSRSPLHWNRWLFTTGGYSDVSYNDNGAVRMIPGYYTDVLGDHVVEFLEDFEQQDDQPWLMYVAPQAPHAPTTPSPEYATAVVPSWDYPASFNEADTSDKPATVRWRPLLSASAVEQTRQQQLRTIMSVDDMVGRIVDEMERLGEDGRTLAIFTSDNGYQWGEHRLDSKRFAYTESSAVPLLVRWPGHIAPGTTDARLVSNVDLLPTLLDASGATPVLKYALDGTSLLSSDARKELLLEYGRSLDAPLPPWASIRTTGAQFVEWYDATTGSVTEREYYDLLVDPLQLVNRLRDGTSVNDPDVGPWSAGLARLRACVGASCLVLSGGGENTPPTARMATPSCAGLACTFSGAASTDADGSVVAYDWTFGDGGSASGATVSHTFASEGSYLVTLNVTDDGGATGSVSRDTAVTTSPAAFRAASSTSGNTRRLAATVPTAVAPGDVLLLFVSANRSGVTLTVPAGWNPISRMVDGTMQSAVWWRSASASDAGSTVAITVGQLTKLDAQVVAYSGMSGTPVLAHAARAEPGRVAGHQTPQITVEPPGAWLVSYWADKTSSATGWTPPTSVVARRQSVGSGTGRITSLSGDSGSAVAAGPAGGLTATSSATSDLATMWSILLAPALADPDPTLRLVDTAAAAGLFELTETWEAEPVDYDGDGDQDLWIGYHDQGGKLWRNDGAGSYTRVALEAWPKVNAAGRIPDRHDCAWADVDQDGRMDAYCSAGRGTNNPVKYDRENELWLQRTPGVFTEVGKEWGLGELCGRSHYVSFLDANADALPDLFVGNAPPRDDPDDPCDDPANGMPSEESKLFLNQGGQALVHAPGSGIGGYGGARCAEVVDFDGDGWDDLLVCGNPQTQLFRNLGGTGFVDIAPGLGIQTVFSDALFADLDGDGDQDLVTAEWGRFSYRLNADGVLGTSRVIATVPSSGGGRSVAVADADGDGDLDVYGLVANATQGTNPPDMLLLNDSLTFTAMPAPAAGGVGDAVAALDGDSDGRSEFLVLNGLEGLGPVQLVCLTGP